MKHSANFGAPLNQVSTPYRDVEGITCDPNYSLLYVVVGAPTTYVLVYDEDLHLRTNLSFPVHSEITDPEGIAFNTRWAMESLEKLYRPVEELNFIGGGAKSNVWCQIFADITNRTIKQVSDSQQAGAKGIALLASMTLGYIDSFEKIKDYISIKNTYKPNPQNRELYDSLFKEFKNLYKQNKKWYKRMNMMNWGKE